MPETKTYSPGLINKGIWKGYRRHLMVSKGKKEKKKENPPKPELETVLASFLP